MLYVYRACAYDELGQLAEAVADCEAALGLAPRGPAAVFALITLALARERLGRTRTSSGAGAGITVTDLGGNFALTSGLLQF